MDSTFWPSNKKFAFSIIDDTDFSTLENVSIVYEYLFSKGIITTKSIWVRAGDPNPIYDYEKGQTIDDTDYFNWIKEIQQKGFEICLHSVTWSHSTREQIIEGFAKFERLFGRSKILVQHNDIAENESIYWGSKRLVFPINLLYELTILFNRKSKRSNIYQGEIETSKYFWGDICFEKIDYIRNLIFPTINLFNISKHLIHKRRSTKYVRTWFFSCEAPDLKSFIEILSERNIRRLVKENGVCIIYTHLGKDFVRNGIINPLFKKAIDKIAIEEGWFVPASEIFEFLKKKNGGIYTLGYFEELRISVRWLLWKLIRGTS